jgi:hypothetical protein
VIVSLAGVAVTLKLGLWRRLAELCAYPVYAPSESAATATTAVAGMARVAIFDAVLRSVFMVSVPCIRNASRAGTVPEGPSQRER